MPKLPSVIYPSYHKFSSSARKPGKTLGSGIRGLVWQLLLFWLQSFILFKQVPLYSPQPHKSLKMMLFFHYVFSCTVTIAQSRMVNAEDKCFWSIICSKKIHQIEGKFYGSAMRPAMKTYFPILVYHPYPTWDSRVCWCEFKRWPPWHSNAAFHFAQRGTLSHSKLVLAMTLFVIPKRACSTPTLEHLTEKSYQGSSLNISTIFTSPLPNTFPYIQHPIWDNFLSLDAIYFKHDMYIH